MSTVDIVLLILLALGAIKGYAHGFIVELFSFLAFFIGLFLALELTIPVSVRLFGDRSFFEIGAVVVFILLFILLSIAIKSAAKGLKKAIDITVFGTLDNIVGAVAGIFKLAFIASIIFWVLDSVGIELKGWFDGESLIFPYIVNIGPEVYEWLSGAMPFIRDLIDSMEQLRGSNSKYMT